MNQSASHVVFSIQYCQNLLLLLLPSFPGACHPSSASHIGDAAGYLATKKAGLPNI
jgi:hypothetical protein